MDKILLNPTIDDLIELRQVSEEDAEQRALDDEESDERTQAFADLDSFEDINY